MSPLTLLTPTGCRPLAWELCQAWMAAQDYAGPVRWLVVDDGEDPQPISFQRDRWDVNVLRPQPYWRRGENTQARNLQFGLAHVPADAKLLIVEDDDHYAPSWLTVAERALSQFDLVGEMRNRYYNIGDRRWREHSNTGHASLCATGVRGPALAFLRTCATARHRFIDLPLWRTYRGSKRLLSSHLVTGIKGLPGRAGICAGHQPAMRNSFPDPTGRQLQAWLGADAEVYLALKPMQA